MTDGHDWQQYFTEKLGFSAWRCARCGISVTSGSQPPQFERFLPARADVSVRIGTVLFMSCEELVADAVMES